MPAPAPTLQYRNEPEFVSGGFTGTHRYTWDQKNEKAVSTTRTNNLIGPSLVPQGATAFTIMIRLRAQIVDGNYNYILGQEGDTTFTGRGLSIFADPSGNLAAQVVADPVFNGPPPCGGCAPFKGKQISALAGNNVLTNVWKIIHVTFDFPANSMKIYIDGIDKTSPGAADFNGGLSGTYFGGPAATAPFTLNGNNAVTTTGLYGHTSVVKYWDSALSSTQVSDDVAAELALDICHTTPLRSYVDVADYDTILGTQTTFLDDWGNTNLEYNGVTNVAQIVNSDIFKGLRRGTLFWWQEGDPDLNSNPFYTNNPNAAGQFSFYRPAGALLSGGPGDYFFIIRGGSAFGGTRNYNRVLNANVPTVFDGSRNSFAYTFNADTAVYKLYKNGILQTTTGNEDDGFAGFDTTFLDTLYVGTGFSGRWYRQHFFVCEMDAAEVLDYHNSEVALIPVVNPPVGPVGRRKHTPYSDPQLALFGSGRLSRKFGQKSDAAVAFTSSALRAKRKLGDKSNSTYYATASSHFSNVANRKYGPKSDSAQYTLANIAPDGEFVGITQRP